MALEDVINNLGAFDAYQRRVFFLLCLFSIPCAWHAIASVFLSAVTDHWCSVPTVAELNCTGLNFSNSQCIEKGKHLTIPRNFQESKYEECLRYNISEIHVYDASSPSDNVSVVSSTVGCGEAGWDYDHTQYESTIVQEFDLVCDREDLVNYAQSIFFAGILCGSVFFGMLSDWIGRYPTFFICIGFDAVIGTIAAFSPNFITFVTLRFFVGMANIGGLITSFVLGTELVGSEYRAMAGSLMAVFFSIGYMTLAVIAYFIRDWRTLQLVLSAPILLFFLLIPIIAESPRWLISKGKFDKAEKVIRKAAKVNKVQLPDVLFDEKDKALEKKMQLSAGRRPTQIDLFRTPKMRLRTMNILYNWFVNNLVYYGLSLSTSGLGVDDYVAAFVSGAVEFPACFSCWFIIQRVGRRWPLCIYMVVGGAACLLTLITPVGVYRTVVAMVGKFCISASFALIYIFSVELYPTVVRSTGMGMSSMSARVSGILSPIILLLGNYWAPLPFIFFGVNSILAGSLTLFLPETIGMELPQTLKEGEEFPNNGPFAFLQKSANKYHHPSDTDEKPGVTDDECRV